MSNADKWKSEMKSFIAPIKFRLHRLLDVARPARSRFDYATHVPVLVGLSQVLRVQRVLELGAGQYSTLTFLDTNLFPELTRLDTFDTDTSWATQVLEWTKGDPRVTVRLTPDPMHQVVRGIDLSDYDLVFIDDSTTVRERAATIKCVAESQTVKLAVIHDFEIPEYRRSCKTFRNRYEIRGLNPSTGVAWNSGIGKYHLSRVNSIICRNSSIVEPLDVKTWEKLFRGV